MARRKTNKAPIIILLVVLLLVAAVLAGMIWFVSNHFFVGGKAYANVILLNDEFRTIS